MVWRGVAWCDVCGVVCCSSFFFSFILFRRRSKKVALPVHLLRQVFIFCFFIIFLHRFFELVFGAFFYRFGCQNCSKKWSQVTIFLNFEGYSFDVFFRMVENRKISVSPRRDTHFEGSRPIENVSKNEQKYAIFR